MMSQLDIVINNVNKVSIQGYIERGLRFSNRIFFPFLEKKFVPNLEPPSNILTCTINKELVSEANHHRGVEPDLRLSNE